MLQLPEEAVKIVPAASAGNDAGAKQTGRPITGTSTSTMDEAQETVPVEMLWVTLERKRRNSYFFKLVIWTFFAVVFTTLTQMLRPVRATFTVQDSLLQHTARAAFPLASWPKTFYDITCDGDWWEWVETVLLPNILSDKYFNGDPRATAWSSRFMNTVAMYNTQTAPVRFRQARVTDDSCDTPAGNSELSRPCWGDFTPARQFKEAYGETYGNRYLTGLNSISGKEGFGRNYGSEAHVVDAPLDKGKATKLVADMKAGLWLNEQTRAISIETNWYNANLDLSTYLLWHIDISPGGRFQPYVVIHSCRLSPYSTTMDFVRMGLEILFAGMVLCFVFAWFRSLYKSIDRKAFLLSPWNLLELVNLASFLVVLLVGAVYLLQDKTPYQILTTASYENRPDLSGLVTLFNLGSNFAAFSLVFSYAKLFKCAQLFPSLGLLWRALELSITDMAPFLFIFLLFTCGFTFAGHWMFGYTMVEFHDWGTSFTTLFQSLMGGLPYEVMSQDKPIGAALFTFAWVLLMCMVFASMFIAILTQWYLQVHQENSKEGETLAREVGPHASDGFFTICFRRIASLMGKADPEEVRFDAAAREIQKALRQADFTDSDWVRKAVQDGTKCTVADVSKHFGGDDSKAYNFVQQIRGLADMEFEFTERGPVTRYLDRGDLEGEDQRRLQKLQGSVGRLEQDLRKLRGALHDSYIARTAAGQAMEGYRVESVPDKTMPRSPSKLSTAQGVPVLPGAVQDS